MDKPIATVLTVTGTVYVRSQRGDIRLLKPGDTVYEGDVVLTKSDGSAELRLIDGEVLFIGESQTVKMTEEFSEQKQEIKDSAEKTDEEAEEKAADAKEGQDSSQIVGEQSDYPHGFIRIERLQEALDAPDYRFVSILGTYESTLNGRAGDPDPFLEGRATHNPRIEFTLAPVDPVEREAVVRLFREFEARERVIDTEPEIGTPENALVDEDDLSPNGNDQSQEPLDGGSLGVVPGGDGVDTFFDGNTPPAGLESAGEEVKYYVSPDGHTLIGYTGDLPPDGVPAQEQRVFEVVINDPASEDGNQSYTFTLLGQLDHPEADGENQLVLTFNFTVEENDGDSASSSFNVTVIDDIPVAEDAVEQGYVEEESLPDGNDDSDDVAGIDGDGDGNNGVWSSSVSGLFSIGADQSGSYSIVSGIDGGAVLTTGGAAVSSDGVAVTYEVVDATTVRGVAGGETVFEVVLDGTTGDYTFTLLGQLDHHAVPDADDVEGLLSLDLSGTIEASDEDGDTVGLGDGSLVITVQDDIPVAEDAVEQGYVEEESLPDGNDDSDDVAGIDGDGDGNNGVWSSSVSGLFSIGADQSGSYSIVSGIDGGAVLTTGGAAVSSDGVAVTYEVVDATTVRGVAGGETVFEVVLDGTTGDYTFTLLGQLDHHAVPDADDVEGLLSLDLSGTIEASDEDGDTVGLGDGSLVITVQDDIPVAEDAVEQGYVEEESLPDGNDDSDDVAGIDGDGDGNNGVWSSSVSGLFSIGADQSGSYSIVSGIDGGAVLTTGGAAVSSDGVAVTYEVVDATTVRGVAGGETVFEVVLDGTTGDYTFTLLGQLDHHAVPDADDVEGLLSLDLSGTIEASDEDGDTVGLGDGSLVITVQDDIPVAEDAVEQGYVEEESLPDGNDDSDDVAGIDGDGDGNNGVWSSSVSGLFSIGADQSGSYSIVSGIDGGAVLTTGGAAVSSDGVAVTYEVVDATTVRGVAGGETVFEVVLDGTTGDYTFTLLGQLDHHAVPDADDVEGLLSLDLSGTIEASDEDGDTVGLGDGSLVITVQDDIPVAEDAVEQGYVEEESLPDGNDDSDDVAGIDGDGDGNNGVWSSSVSGLFSIGADQSGSYSIVSGIDGGAVLTTGGAAVSSDGVAVTYEVVDATTVRGVAGGETVFEVVLDGTTGDYTFTLLGQLDHHAVPDADDVEGLLSLDLSGTIEASDEDGDTVGLGDGSLVITVQDDIPVAEDAVEQGYVEEESLPDGNDDSDDVAGIDGDGDGNNGVWSSSVSGLFSIGADQSGSYSIVSGIDGGAVLTTGGAAVSSDGVAVTYEVVDATTVRGVAGGETVFEVVLDGTTGDYTFTLLGQLDHHAVPDADDVEGLLSLDLSGTIEASDEDGDTVGLGDGSLVITVQDDIPVAEDAVEQGYVEEESLPDGNDDSDDVAGIDGDGDGNNGVWSSSVSGLFSIGADQSGSYSIVSGIDGGAVLTTGGAAVSSDGVAVTYEVVDATTVRGVAGGETVFEVVLDGTTGDYTFTLLGQLDHHAVPDADDVEGLLSLDLSGTIEASDEDGDTVGLGDGSLVITVQDDIPVAEDAVEQGYVEEESLPDGNDDSDDVAGIDGDGDGNNGVWSSSVSGLFSIGADQSGSYSIVSGIDGGAVLTTGGAAVSSDGVAVTYEVVDATTVRGVAGGETVFEVVLDGTTGDYTFTLLGQLDHHAVPDADDVEGLLSLDLSGTIEASDEDGDTVGLGDGSLVITVQDDIPVAEDAVEQGYVEEESLPDGNDDSDDVAGIDGDGDGNNGVWSSSVSGLFSIGADQSGSYSIVSGIDGGAVLTTGGAAVSSDGVAVTYEVVDATTVRGVAGGETVFEVVLDGTTGDYTFTLLGQLDHHAVPDADDVEGLLSLDLSGTIEASDEDGDTVGLGDGSLVITVQDDIPVAEDAVEQGYVEEESLPDGNDDSDDVAGIDGDGDGNNGVWSSSVSGLFSIGADQSGSYSIVSGIDGGAVLTTGGAAVSSDGVAVTYEVVDATTVRGVAGGETVFEVVLDGTTGDYTFTLLGQLDHHAVPDADDVEGLLSLDLSGTIEASDEDGDTVGLGDGSLVITVQDDIRLPKMRSSRVMWKKSRYRTVMMIVTMLRASMVMVTVTTVCGRAACRVCFRSVRTSRAVTVSCRV
ncbi:retention module-containing protein [Prosthecochloris sp. SCSIO W1103]|uniref:retention module-containing protein n=1 Tax=Prosthecochloris sp. SCSIO W1103 TaxID=2992244 RepID=UPI00223DBD4D|nr:retention module-containing protein [Prosthecochloris sp. SCSIO W1103]UZJ38404.1 retention module-containing protein [Prosthecochloris sp. SCSIO W1103]